MSILGIHQPGYLPWLGFFKKMMNSDVFVYLDALFVKKNFYNRNKIKLTSGPTFLTVPIIRDADLFIKDVKIDNSSNWASKHKKSILFNYSKAPFFNDFWFFFEELYEKNFSNLIDLNMEVINFVKEQLDIKCKTLFSSELKINSTSSDRILEICNRLNMKHYISGTVWASDFLKLNDFEKNSIIVEFQEFQHPVYDQINGTFEPYMSIIDLLFNKGKVESKKILLDSTVIKKFISTNS